MDISSTGPIQPGRPGSVGNQRRVDQAESFRKRLQESESRSASEDRVSLSERAQLFKKLAEAIHRSPEVRRERVEELREAIERGRYQVSDSEIAAAILRSVRK